MTKRFEDQSGNLAIIWHIHQPTFIPDKEVIHQINESYSLLLETHKELEIPFVLNITGCLLERISTLDSSFIKQLQNFVAEGLIELTATGYFHPNMALISQKFARKQIELDILIKKRIFKTKIHGFWPTDLAWVPWMVNILAENGIKWVVLDSPTLELANSLPQWGTQYINGYNFLSPEISSLTLSEEHHQPYLMRLAGDTLTIILRDRKLSLELSDFDTGVVYDHKRIDCFIQKLNQFNHYQRIVVLGEDGERINAQTARNYKLFLSELQSKAKVNFAKPTSYLKTNQVADEKYFPASTFQYDLNAWKATVDDQMLLSFMQEVENYLETFDLVLKLKPSSEASKLKNKAERLYLQTQDSGSVFWKYHARTRVPIWNDLTKCKKIIQTGLEKCFSI